MFSKNSFAIVYGLQLWAVQKMLDFDFLVWREPSVLACIDPGKKTSHHKVFYWDHEIVIQAFWNFQDIPSEILKKVDTCINFASFRSSYEATLETLKIENIKNIVIIAEWIPESQSRKLIELNKTYKKNIIGPATVGAMVSGEMRIGNTGWSLENIISSKLFRKWSVWLVTKSGGMSNEMRKIISQTTDGTHTSIALGWDRYTISTFVDIIKEYEKNDEIKMIVLLGEVGGNDENIIAQMIQKGEITKPVVAHCIGTIWDLLPSEVQFGHAWAKANSDTESAKYKNLNLKKSGAIVPESFIDFWEKIQETFEKYIWKIPTSLENESILEEKIELIQKRRPTKLTSSISDERGDELLYNKIPVNHFVESGSIVRVIGHLWLKKELPEYALKALNTMIILLADHGPAVSWSTNAIITSRAGNDLKSSLISALATVGPRFGGAIDGAGKYFFEAVQESISPSEFVAKMKKLWIPIPGIGHKVKSKFHPDTRCQVLFELSKYFPSTQYLKFALEVEKLTLEKKSNLILNVDGYIAAMMLDIFENIWLSTKEIENYLESGVLNWLFLFSRSIGFIGHALDQKRLDEGLYRTSWEDILYL